MCVAGCLEYESPHMNLLRATIFSWRCFEMLAEYREVKLLEASKREHGNVSDWDLHMRFGLCEGPVAAGVIGSERLQ